MFVSLLSACELADFNVLFGTTGLTRDNLSTHMAKLVAARYVAETKPFVNREQLTQYPLTPVGRGACTRDRGDWMKLANGHWIGKAT
jgi:hypothetical protein